MRDVQRKALEKARACRGKPYFGYPPITVQNGRLLAQRGNPIFLIERNAQRAANINVLVRRGVPHPLRRPVLNSELLQQAAFAPTARADSPTHADLERLPSGRFDFGFSLPPYCRSAAG